MSENDNASAYREIAVLSIVPGIVGVLILVSWGLAHWEPGPYWLNAGPALVATLFGGYLRFISGFKDIFNRKITVNVFVTVALIATIAVGEFRAAAVIVFIMSVAGALESYTLDKTRRSIRNLLDLTPKMATVRRGDQEVAVPVSEVRIGDIVVASVKEVDPRSLFKKGQIVRAVIVRTRKEKSRPDGSYVRFDDNAAVIIGKDNLPKSTRIFGPIAREIKDLGYKKIASMAQEIV